MFDRYRRERKSWRWFAGIIFGFIFLVGILYGRMIQVRKEATRSFINEAPPLVKAIIPKSRTTWRMTSVLARVESAQIIQVRADVGGWVDRRPVRRGMQVKKGQPILILRDERKMIMLKEARARLAAARATLNDLRRRLEQTQRLYRDGIVSKDMLDSLQHQVEAQAANVNALEATVSRMQWDVDHLMIRAPINGRIVEIVPDVGQEVMPGEPVARLISTHIHRVFAGVDSQLAKNVHPGVEVTLIRTQNHHVERRKARVVGISPAIDPISGTYKLEAEFIDNDIPWWSGETVYMLIPVEKLNDVIVLPRTAVLSDNNGTFIYVVKDHKALQVPVTVTWINDREGAIPANLIPRNTPIIIEGMVGLADGQTVQVKILEHTMTAS